MMKRWLILVGLVALLLCGCQSDPAQTTSAQTTATETTQATTLPDPGTYDPDSRLEAQTDGAVRAYKLDMVTGQMLYFMGRDPVVVGVGHDGYTALLRLSGENCSVKASRTLDIAVETGCDNIAVTENRLAYYDGRSRSYVLLDGQFRETGRAAMPEDIVGVPTISGDMSVVYYCTDTQLRALDIQAGVSRLVWQFNDRQLYISGLLFDDTVLECYVEEENGNGYTALIRCETGVMLGTDPDLIRIESWGERFFLQRLNSSYVENLVGNLSGELQCFNPAQEGDYLHCLPQTEAVLAECGMLEDVQLDYYDLVSERRLASVTFGGCSGVTDVAMEQDGQFVWLLTYDTKNAQAVLCRWELAANAVSDQTDYVGTRYTAEAPDTEGLARCEAWAQSLEEQYHVQIDLVDAPVEPEDYRFTHEYQVPAIEYGLAQLEQALASYPEGFFRTAAKVSDNGTITIGLVRELHSNHHNAPGSAAGIQYWLDGSIYITVSIDERTCQHFYHEMCHALDTFVYSFSIEYDAWDTLNPEGFAYDENYLDYLTRTDMTYLEGETRAFIDHYSMTFENEDRARIMEYAMMEGNEACFETPAMQAKLRQLCLGIREAFGWEKSAQTFRWEQYLEESLAYTEK